MHLIQNSIVKTEMKLQNLNPKFIIPLGAISGLLIGITARFWMRWISTEPEFSWSGSIFIVLAITIFFTAHSTVYFAARRQWSKRSRMFVRIGAIVLSLPTFSAAGGMMLPTVVTGSLAIWRKSLPKWFRILLGIASLIVPMLVIKDIGADFGWGLATLGRILLFFLIYGAIIAVTRSTVVKSAGGRKKRSREEVVITLVVLTVIIAGVLLAMGIAGGDS